MKEHGGCVYIMADKTDAVLYIGVTSDLVKRVFEHKSNCIERTGTTCTSWFTTRYSVTFFWS